MSKNVDAANVTRRRFLAVAGSVAATSSLVPGKDSTLFAAPSPPTPVADYPVAIDVSDPTNIKYSTPAQGDASTLDKVTTGQTFTWTLKPLSKFHLAILFPKTPFSVHGFMGSQDDASQGKIGGKITATVGGYKYWVIAHDDATGKTFIHDPKIIVGRGFDAEDEIDFALDDLKVADEKLSKKPELQERIHAVEKALNDIIHQLTVK
jgi:hypothetical protein